MNASYHRRRLELTANVNQDIEASTAQIWPHILDPNTWKQGLRTIPLKDRSADGRMLYAMKESEQSEKVEFYGELLERVEPKIQSLKLVSVDGQLIGFASWTLLPLSERQTRVNYRVFSEHEVPQDYIAFDAVQWNAANREFLSINQQRFQAELVRLAEVVTGQQG